MILALESIKYVYTFQEKQKVTVLKLVIPEWLRRGKLKGTKKVAEYL